MSASNFQFEVDILMLTWAFYISCWIHLITHIYNKDLATVTDKHEGKPEVYSFNISFI